jgi:hypothetical protein
LSNILKFARQMSSLPVKIQWKLIFARASCEPGASVNTLAMMYWRCEKIHPDLRPCKSGAISTNTN